MSGQNIEIVKLQIRRGPEAELPILDSGEPAITTDTNKFFIGDGANNHQLANLGDLANVNTQLAQNASLAVNFENYSPDGTGVNDNLSAFTQAVNKASSINKVSTLPVPIELAPGTYRIVKTADLTIPSLICRGGFATIVVEDPYAFVISSNFTLSNVIILSKNTYAKTDSTLKPIFKAVDSTVDNISFNNVVFDSQLSATDGTVRASACVNLNAVTNFKLNNVTVKGYRQGFFTNGVSNNIKGHNLHFENVELPLYNHASDPNVTDTNYTVNVQYSNISHVNTQTQSQNYNKQAGSDTFLFEKCDTVEIINVHSEYPVERACYFSSCKNVSVDNWNLKNALGIKFVGYVRNDTGPNTIADTCHISNVHVKTDTVADVYVAEFYFAQNLTVKNCTISGNSIATSLVTTRHYVNNLVIENCYGENLKRGLYEFQYFGTIVQPSPIPNNPDGNYPAGINGLIIRNNTVKNSNTLDYNVIKIVDNAPAPNGTYRYQNISIANNRINNSTENFGLATSGYCKGLINIDSVQNLRLEDNRIYGYLTNDVNGNAISLPIQIGSNSNNVSIKHKETVRNQDFKYNFGTLYLSADSEITINTISKLFSYQDTAVVTLKHDSTDQTLTKNLSTAFRIKGVTSISNSTDFSLALIGGNITGYSLPNLFGTVDISTDGGDVGGYIITGAGAVSLKANSTALFVTSTTDTKFALFKDGTLPRFLMRYKVAPSASFIVNYTLNAS